MEREDARTPPNFAKLKDWRRIATRYDRCAHIFLSAVLLGATLIFWL